MNLEFGKGPAMKRQKKFKVTLRRVVSTVRTYEVEAPSRTKAEDKATQLACTDDWNSGYMPSSSDFDTEAVEEVK